MWNWINREVLGEETMQYDTLGEETMQYDTFYPILKARAKEYNFIYDQQEELRNEKKEHRGQLDKTELLGTKGSGFRWSNSE